MNILAETAITAVDYCAIGGYLVLMIVVGLLCRSMSSDISDYIRMGGKSTWWMAGLSVFMASFSCATFTGYAAQGYLAGWSFMVNYWMVALLFFVQAALFAPMMRRTRAVTPPDAIRSRFGPVVEQTSVYVGLLGSFVWGGVFLWTLATFTSTVFGMDINWVIVMVGIVILFYSVAGGSWSVQITDNLQSLLLIPMTIVMAWLALKEIGGVDALFSGIKEAGLSEDFAMIKSNDHVYSATTAKVKPMFYTVPWLLAMLFSQFVAAANIRSCYRYLSIKTGSEARKAALLAGTLTFLGSFIWVIPVMVGRLKFSAEIEALDLKYPADGAYAVVASRLLPPGMLGLVIVAMFSATMSSLDSNLTGTAGLLTKNVYVPLARTLGYKPLEGKKLLLMAKIVNLFLGLWAIGCALLFANYGQGGIFGTMVMILALIGIPSGMPFVVSLLMRKIPFWGPLVGMGTGFAASAFMKWGAKPLWLGRAPYWHEIVFIVGGCALIPTILTRFFWYTAKADYRKRVDDFFKQLATPIDIATEIGEEQDHSHLKTVGGLGLLMATFLIPLVIYAFVKSSELGSTTNAWAAVGVFGFIFVISGGMYLRGRKLTLEKEAVEVLAVESEPADD